MTTMQLPWPTRLSGTGNINQLVVNAESYAQQLERTGGLIAEFVNPKYADSTRNKFKSPTRLECMMQDYAKELPPQARTGFTVINEVCLHQTISGCFLGRCLLPAMSTSEQTLPCGKMKPCISF